MSWLLVFYYFLSAEIEVETEVRITPLKQEVHDAQLEPTKLMNRQFFGEQFKIIEAEENEKRR
ncbi:hypothetical protein [Rubritalea profundi]|uniref:Uncharacterized protein n=1 Tax=Rubritalea profundi TaxID=1658618 RepID=A0A2S7U3Q6_9BACT|nr:hypothetical protein [Rubritalea profundi]PQJ29648.1 hypothetical protein BSZ32_14890 [Rubritalea profundi]